MIWFCKAIVFLLTRPDPLLHVYDTLAWPGFTRLQEYIIFPLTGLTHFCMFIIHRPDLVLQGYIMSPLTQPDPLLHVYDTSAWSGFTRLHYFPHNHAWPTFACLWYIGLIWFYKATLFSPWPGLTHLYMFMIYRPDLVLQGYIIFPMIRPDPLLHVYDTSAWSGFTRLHYFPLDQAWPTFACLWYIGLIWFYKAPLFSP